MLSTSFLSTMNYFIVNIIVHRYLNASGTFIKISRHAIIGTQGINTLQTTITYLFMLCEKVNPINIYSNQHHLRMLISPNSINMEQSHFNFNNYWLEGSSSITLVVGLILCFISGKLSIFRYS